MLTRLSALLIVAASSAWIAGYIAIVLPVIIGRMQPGGQNGNFTMWADAGWPFFIIIALCLAIHIYQYLQQRRVIAVTVAVILILSIGYFQYRGSSDTYAVAHAFEQRHGLHENTQQYQDIDQALQVAHKSSERSIGTLLLILFVSIGFSAAQILSIKTNSVSDES